MPILTAILLTAFAATPAVARPPLPAAKAYAAITALPERGSDRLCIRSGWGHATSTSNHLIRRGDCRTRVEWRARGIVFAPEARGGRS